MTSPISSTRRPLAPGQSSRGPFGHGTVINGAVYQTRAADIRDSLPMYPTAADETRIRHEDLDLRVDHRLGRNFPKARRQALHEVSDRVDQGLDWVSAKAGLKAFWDILLGGEAESPDKAEIDFVLEEYGSVLSKAELAALFSEEELCNPHRPVPH